MHNVYLKVHFLEKDTVKSLGAKWDPVAKQWYIPHGLDLTIFSKWLPESNHYLLDTVNTIEPTQNRSIKLSELLQKVSRSIAAITPELEWVTAEISEIRSHKATGHYYLELIETTNGELLSKVKAIILKNDLSVIIENFKKITGNDLHAGIQILVLVKLNFSIQYGLSLHIKDLDPAYTLGDLAAKLAKIRKRLQEEKIYTKNQELSKPIEFTKVAVLSPYGAAGLGDFQKEAMILERHNLCQFYYYTAQFQGKEATIEITNALSNIFLDHQNINFEVVVIIRGGGAIIDLAWLNDYEIAKLICNSPIPVFSGIGHERDHTIIDEISNVKFDTPSKVVAGIFNSIVNNANQAAQHAKEINTLVNKYYIENFNLIKYQLNEIIKLSEINCINMIQHITQNYNMIVINMHNHNNLMLNIINQQQHNITQYVMVNLKHIITQVDHCYLEINLTIPKIYQNIAATTPRFLEIITNSMVNIIEQSSSGLVKIYQDLGTEIYKIHHHKSLALQSLIANIITLDPKQTLSRGYAIIRDQENNIVTSKLQAIAKKQLQLEFYDGIIKTKIMEDK